MFDTVTIDDAFTDLDLARGEDMQTKSLCSVLSQYRILAGRLELKKLDEWHDEEFHGDMLLTGSGQGGIREYVARFTHGTLEWIRPLETCPIKLVERLGYTGSIQRSVQAGLDG